MISYATFVADPVFAGFATPDLPRQMLIAQLLRESDCEESPSKWLGGCDYRERAIKYLTAHKLTIYDRLASGSQTSAGIPQSISVSSGGQSISFELPKAEEILKYGDYAQTRWGIEYLRLKRLGRKPFVGRIV